MSELLLRVPMQAPKQMSKQAPKPSAQFDQPNSQAHSQALPELRWLDMASMGLDFDLPKALEASEPPEAHGLRRDDVRLMVSHYSDDRVTHTQFDQIGEHVRPGDLLVINTSGTLPAALNATREDGTPLELHLSTHLPADLWVVELRTRAEATAEAKSDLGTQPFLNATAGETIHLPGGGTATLLVPYSTNRQHDLQDGPQDGLQNDPHHSTAQPVRLWVAAMRLPQPLNDYLMRHGFPIRYGYVPRPWPLSYYQTAYATEPGSAEMPSAGRAFTPELITRLVAQGVLFAPLILHTGVASLEAHEPPYDEWYRVPVTTASLVNAARASGGRIIAVGTTAVRALETVTDERGVTHPGEGWTRLIVTPQRGVRAVDGLLTGLHEPRASHLLMLEAIAGRAHLHVAYAQALRERYLWHEFGDLHLIVP